MKKYLVVFSVLLVGVVLIYIPASYKSRLSALQECSDYQSTLDKIPNIISYSYLAKKHTDSCKQNFDKSLTEAEQFYNENSIVVKDYITEYSELLKLASQQFADIEYNDIVQLKNVNLAFISLANKQEAVTKLLSQDKQQCQDLYDYQSCTCTNLQVNETLINELEITNKVKQLIVPALNYTQLSTNNKNYQQFGGYIAIDSLSYKNSASFASDIAKLTSYDKIPSFLGVDAEGGIVQRFSWVRLSSIRELKHLTDQEFCVEITKQANLIKEVGFNWSLSPIVDVSSNGSNWINSRTIGDGTTEVAEQANRYIECMKQNKILTTAKHFPGHGGAQGDSHEIVPVVRKPIEDWLMNDKPTFSSAIATEVEFVMPGHLKFPMINDEISSLSSYWMNEVLREDMGFKGLIVTDDLNMLHPKNIGECADLVANSITAGADLALIVNSANCPLNELVNYLVINQKISEDVLDERLSRVLAVKQQYLCE